MILEIHPPRSAPPELHDAATAALAPALETTPSL